MPDPRPDDLVRELRALADRLDVPAAPDVRAAVRTRLAAGPRPRTVRRWGRRWAAGLTAAVVALLVGLLPPGRAAVADVVGGLLRFAGVQVRPEPPTGTGPGAPLPSTRPVTLDEARRLARFTIGVPARLGAPPQVSLADPGPDGAPRVVTLGYRGGAVQLDEFDGELDPAFQKTAQNATWTSVGRWPALWFATGHDVVYVDRDGAERTATARLAGPTLIWAVGPVTYRLEGPFTLPEAVAIAASVPD